MPKEAHAKLVADPLQYASLDKPTVETTKIPELLMNGLDVVAPAVGVAALLGDIEKPAIVLPVGKGVSL